MSKSTAAPATICLINFISEDQLDKANRMKGERAEDDTAQRDKILFQRKNELELELDFRKFWEEFRSSSSEKEKDNDLNLAVDILLNS
ncbi:hypothetical protein GUJ93_ZPchr0012g19789 [Zizania palustris]|uniref:Uncharacterized protein n=1 Tax=Zizania palustris TaxID=103762 RepID=A0A8J5WJJ6_ZIZPA|nr:hypothetical protein GUJ93_ZPchr0012g19789 [Zizania palustris]